MSAQSAPLSGIRVLVGRARHQAGALSGELRKLGAQVIEIPFIEIRKLRSFKRLDDALKNLGTYDWLILTSVNGVESMWKRMRKLHLTFPKPPRDRGLTSAGKGSRKVREFTRANAGPGKFGPSAPVEKRPRIAAIGPATKKAIEVRGLTVDIIPKEYVAESVVRSLKRGVKGKRVLLVRARAARDVIPRELRKAGASVDVVEAYQTVVPQSSRSRLRIALKNPKECPHVVTFTSSSTVRNFVELLGPLRAAGALRTTHRRGRPRHASLEGILTASIGPITSSTLRELGLPVNVEAKEFTIPGLVEAIVRGLAKAC
jgi:uroporphyrinogen-III synthase